MFCSKERKKKYERWQDKKSKEQIGPSRDPGSIMDQGRVDRKYQGSNKTNAFFMSDLPKEHKKKARIQRMEQNVRKMVYESVLFANGIINKHRDLGERPIKYALILYDGGAQKECPKNIGLMMKVTCNAGNGIYIVQIGQAK